MSTIAIGDIHGCVRTLEALLDQLRPAPEDRLVFIGDYIDRGPDSKAVIDLLLELRLRHRCTFLRGNHEAMMLRFLDYDDRQLWDVNGGISTLESYRQNGHPVIPASHEAFVRDTLLYYVEEDFFFVHAGLKPGFSIADNLALFSEEVFLWERSHLGVPDPVWEKTVVCGHTPQRQPINTAKLICIDTGCVYHTYPGYGYLTAVRLPERKMLLMEYRG